VPVLFLGFKKRVISQPGAVGVGAGPGTRIVRIIRTFSILLKAEREIIM
jgi:hypothetical protein